MDIIILVINLIAMVATVISCVQTIKAKKETKEAMGDFYNNFGIQNIQDKSIKNTGNIKIDNSGTNSGVIGGIINGEPNRNN